MLDLEAGAAARRRGKPPEEMENWEVALGVPAPRVPFSRRVFMNIRKADNGCWNWIGTIGNHGYGVFILGGKINKHRFLAHRIVHTIIIGDIPQGMVIDHLCRNTRCVNPAHLEVVTQIENCLRGVSPLALNARKTHCKHGHELLGRNLFLKKAGRECRECKRIKDRRLYWERKTTV